MKSNLVNSLYLLIKLQGYRSIPRRRIELNYLSHPEIGNLNAITDTLQRLDVPCEAIKTSTVNIYSLTEPVLVLLNYDERLDFYLVKIQGDNRIKIYNSDNNWKSISKEDFDKICYGIVVLCNRNEKKEKLNIRFSNLILPYLLLCFFVIYGYSLSENTFQFLFFILSFVGLYVAFNTYIYQFESDSGILNKICNSGSKTDCNSVISSKFSNVFLGITFSDLAIVYFLFYLLYYTLFKNELNGLLVPFLISLLVIPFTFYSIYLQGFVIKLWCSLCLILILIIYLQAIISIQFVLSSTILFSLNDGYNFIFSIILASGIWFVIKPLIKKIYSFDIIQIEYLKFKRNYKLFIYSILNEKQISISDIPGTTIHQNSNKDVLQLTLITNPSCHHCIKAIDTLKKILFTYKNEVNLNHIFYVSTVNKTDPSVLQAITILNSFETIPDCGLNILQNHHDVFPNKNGYQNILDSDSYELYYNKLVQQQSWCNNNGIIATPTLIIGNKMFPSFFEVSDLQYFMDELIQMQTQSKPF